MHPLLIIGNTFSKAVGLSPEDEQALYEELSFVVPDAAFDKDYQSGIWDGRQRLYSLDEHTFPTGLISWVLRRAKGAEIEDQRKPAEPAFAPHSVRGVRLYRYQADAASSAVETERGVIRAATGSGKSLIAAEIIAKLGVRSLVTVHLTPLLYQMRDSLQSQLNVGRIGVIGDGVFEPGVVTVAMTQTLHARREQPEMVDFLKTIDCLIADEVHHAAGDALYDIAMNLDARYRFGLSATPWRTDGRDLLIHAATGRTIVNLSASALIGAGYLARPEVIFHRVPPIEIGALSYKAAYKRAIVQNVARNGLVADVALGYIGLGKRVLVAVTQVAHGKAILAEIRRRGRRHERLAKRGAAAPRDLDGTTVFIQGENESLEKTQALENLNTHRLDCVIATTVFGEGVDVPNLDVLINAKGNRGRVETIQIAGRALRKTKTKLTATIVDFMDHARYFTDAARSRLATYRTEDAFDVKAIDGLILPRTCVEESL